MPRGHGKRSMGSGKGFGFCSYTPGEEAQGQQTGRGLGRGFGYCSGSGLRWRTRKCDFSGQTTPEEERTILQNQMDLLQKQLSVVKERLEKLSPKETKEN